MPFVNRKIDLGQLNVYNPFYLECG